MLLMRDDWWFAIEEPRPDPATSSWKKGNQKALATIVLFLSDNQMHLVKDVTTAKDAWMKLKSFHEKATMTSRVSLLKRICNMNMTEGQEMEKHLFELEELFDRLHCAGQQLDTSLRIAMMLRSVPDSYDGLVTALESRKDEDLTIELVKQKLMDEWQRRSERLGNPGESDEKALKLYTKRQEQKVCYYCSKPGHFKRNCRLFKREQCGKEDEERTATAKQAAEAENPICFTVGSRQCKGRWFVDSGCSNHMTNDRRFFKKLDETVTVDVILADGSRSKSAGIGEGLVKCLGSDGKLKEILIKEVMYVPELCSGLLSVRKLTRKGFRVQFGAKRCDIIGLSGKLVAVGELNDDLYELKTEEMVNARNSSRRQQSCRLVLLGRSCETGIEAHSNSTVRMKCVYDQLAEQYIQEELSNGNQYDRLDDDLKLLTDMRCLTKQNEFDSTRTLEQLRWHKGRCVRNKCVFSDTMRLMNRATFPARG